MMVKKEMNLLYDTWGSGRDAVNLYDKWGLLDEVEAIIASWIADDEEATEETVNDILSYEDNAIAEALGYSDYEELYRKMEEED